MSGQKYVPSMPQQGAMFHHLTGVIAANHSGIGPNNVATNPYKYLVGLPFQKPLSSTSTAVPVAPGQEYQ